jgi:hypothetical protein
MKSVINMVCKCGHAEYFHRYYDNKRRKIMVKCGYPKCNCKEFKKHEIGDKK